MEKKIAKLDDFVTHFKKASQLLQVDKQEKERWILEVLNLIQGDAGIREVITTPKGLTSLLVAISKAASINLGFGGAIPHCHLIRFGEEVSLLIGYKGMIAVAEANGVNIAAVQSVFENDKISALDLNAGHPPTHTIDIKLPRGELVGFYCSAVHNQTKIGRTVWMSVGQVEQHREKYARKDKGGRFSAAWENSFEAMGKKTVIRQCLNHIGFNMSVKGFGFSPSEDNESDESVSEKASKLLDFVKKEKGKELPAVATPTAPQEKQLDVFGD